MKKVQLLDCTLRDGGYVNDWKFGYNNLINIFERSTQAGCDIVEVGFLDDRRPFDHDRSIMPNTDCVKKIWGNVTTIPPKVVGMIDFGTCSIENVTLCEQSFLDGIRVIFKECNMHAAMKYCKEIKELGYLVFVQLVSITSYTKDKLQEIIKLVNSVKPYAVSIVDTYGLLYPKDVLYYYNILDKYIDKEINIGFHGHNNLQLAYANAISFLEKETKHNIIIDGTLYGMGKKAGNAPIELLAKYLNEQFDKDYKINAMLEGIEESILDFYHNSPWGYKLCFYQSALNKCHPEYVTYFKDTHTLSISKQNELLSQIPEEDKLLFNSQKAENIYKKFIEKKESDTDVITNLKSIFQNKKLLLIGPGKNICLQREKVEEYIKNNKPCIIAVNYIPNGINSDYVFITNARRYHNMQIGEQKTIATSNVECRSREFDFTVNLESLIEKNEKIVDNSFLMLLKLLQSIGISYVSCAGFDGYSETENNYFDLEMEYVELKEQAQSLNEHVRHTIAKLRENMQIDFITFSIYNQETNVYSATF